ncbi:MAG: DUF6456 domain-containing protein [Rhodobacterales bacterium]|nr:DUF6456 domain-containing protein [Rhodobacterales bacterium]
MHSNRPRSQGTVLPSWVPDAARHYLAHTEKGLTIRAIARQSNVHASTVLRQVRRLEALRDDPLVDNALRHLSLCMPSGDTNKAKDKRKMLQAVETANVNPSVSDTREFEQEAVRVLRRLTETGAMLAVARDMEMGVVVRELPGGGTPQRTAVVERRIAEAMALKDWINSADPSARIARYHLTAAGRAALKRLMATRDGFAEAPARFDGPDPDLEQDPLVRHMRSTLAESPLVGLARRKDKDGEPFLDRRLVAAGERLREDFELSLVGPRVTQSWEQFLTAGVSPTLGPDPKDSRGTGARSARDRVIAALTDLGPGLADVALRCCCFLEGLENLEKRMGWSARSGKIVLRIALQRLLQHYEQTQGRYGPKIG